MAISLKHLVVAALSLAAAVPAAAATFDLGSHAPPYSTSYGNSFGAGVSGFVDDFTFTMSPAGAVNSITATIKLGDNFLNITGLQARLYQGAGPFVFGSTPLEQAWSTPLNSPSGAAIGEIVVISPIVLAADTYTLEVRGTVQGAFGGSYSGVLNLADGSAVAVPEPESYAMLLAGLALMVSLVSRQRKPR